MKLKEGTYTGKQLCEMVGYDYKKYINDPRTLINKLNKICEISKLGRGKGLKYHIANVKLDLSDFVIDRRADFNSQRKDITTSTSLYSDILTYNEINEIFDGYYVYRHILDDEVIYVGKGCRRRAVRFDKRPYEDLKDNITVEIVRRFDNEQETLKFEEQLIKYYISVGQCKYNSQKTYHCGITREIESKDVMCKNRKEILFNKKIDKEYKKMFKYRI